MKRLLHTLDPDAQSVVAAEIRARAKVAWVAVAGLLPKEGDAAPVGFPAMPTACVESAFRAAFDALLVDLDTATEAGLLVLRETQYAKAVERDSAHRAEEKRRPPGPRFRQEPVAPEPEVRDDIDALADAPPPGHAKYIDSNGDVVLVPLDAEGRVRVFVHPHTQPDAKLRATVEEGLGLRWNRTGRYWVGKLNNDGVTKLSSDADQFVRVDFEPIAQPKARGEARR